VSDLARCGARLEKGDGLALIHARDDDSAARAEAIVRKAYSLAQDAPAPMPLLVEKLTG
jgi:thymidine phosphorylase